MKLWLTKSKQEDQVNVKNARICELHFPQECFERDLRGELLGLHPRKCLKRMSILSLLLPNQKDANPTFSKRDLRYLKRMPENAL